MPRRIHRGRPFLPPRLTPRNRTCDLFVTRNPFQNMCSLSYDQGGAGAGRESSWRRPIMNRALWIVQGLLALFFALGSGAPKLLLPPETLPMPIPLPDLFLRFIGVAEVLGGLGLILPGLLRI